MSDKSLYTRSVERALDILECFIDCDVLSLHEIAEATSLPDSTALRIINSLRKRGYIARVHHAKTYHLGERFLLFTALGDRSYVKLKTAAASEMQLLYDVYDENVQLFTFNGTELCSILAYESTKSPHLPVWMENRKWCACAAGRVFLAYQDERQREFLDPAMQIEKDTLEKIFDDGYTLCVDPSDISIVGIAAPVCSSGGILQAVLQLSGPASRFVNETIMDKIKDTACTAQKISHQLAEHGMIAVDHTEHSGGSVML